MNTTIRRGIGLGLIAMVAGVAIAGPAWSQDRGHGRDQDRRDDRGRDHDRRDDRGRDDNRRDDRGRNVHEQWRGQRFPEHRAADPGWQREWARRQELERHRAAATWRFEQGRGWRHYYGGVWSPLEVWWWIGGRALLRPIPVVRVVTYPTGRYELLGDGITVPFYWVWRPAVVVAAPPPLPEPPPMVYPAPPDYAYPPPPPPPPGG